MDSNSPNPKPRKPSPQGPGLKFSRGLSGWFIVMLMCLAILFLLNKQDAPRYTVQLSDVSRQLERNNVKLLTLRGDELEGEFVQPIKQPAAKREVGLFRCDVPPGSLSGWLGDRLFAKLTETGVEIRADNSQAFWTGLLIALLPWLVIIGFLYFAVIRQFRGGGGGPGGMLGNFGRSRHKLSNKETVTITFGDVAGIQEAKDEVHEIVQFLKNPKKFQRLGGRIPRGVLLVGEPGTGKTLLARAIAGEAEVPFFSISGSEFVEMFVGVGASRVRDLFKQAKDNSPCIIFLDEIDAVGRRRGSGFSTGGNEEREQTLNAILVEMDGFDTNDQVIVVAATNRVDVLDPALTRPGRFDRQISVPLPDVKGRLEILKVHSRKIKLSPTADLARLARATPGFSGADLAAIINEAAIRATMLDKAGVDTDDLEEARDKVRWGRARRSRVIDEKERLATAYHEAGHAVVQSLNPDADPVHKVTILPRGVYGGATMSLPEKDKLSYSKRWCIATIQTCFGGRIAEELFCGDVNTGAAGDIRQATHLANRMVRDWGMSDKVGFVYYGDSPGDSMEMALGKTRDYSDETARLIDDEVRALIEDLYGKTTAIINANRDAVERVARALLQYETLDAADLGRLIEGLAIERPVDPVLTPPPTPPVS